MFFGSLEHGEHTTAAAAGLAEDGNSAVLCQDRKKIAA